MGPGGNSVSAAQAKLSNTEKTKPARPGNPSLMIYTREQSVACSCRRRSTRDAACLSQKAWLDGLSTTRKVPVWLNTVGWTSCAHGAQTGTTSVGGWMDDPSDRRSISAHGGGDLAKRPGFGGAEL